MLGTILFCSAKSMSRVQKAETKASTGGATLEKQYVEAQRVHSSLTERRFLPVLDDGGSAPKI